jgi:hypothetical protein
MVMVIVWALWFSIFVRPNVVNRPLPLHTIKGEGGALDRKKREREGMRTCDGNILNTHTQTPHTHT